MLTQSINTIQKNKQIAEISLSFTMANNELITLIDMWIEKGFTYDAAYHLASNNNNPDDFSIKEITELTNLSTDMSEFIDFVDNHLC